MIIVVELFIGQLLCSTLGLGAIKTSGEFSSLLLPKSLGGANRVLPPAFR
jgi:hypothetical protein